MGFMDKAKKLQKKAEALQDQFYERRGKRAGGAPSARPPESGADSAGGQASKGDTQLREGLDWTPDPFRRSK